MDKLYNVKAIVISEKPLEIAEDPFPYDVLYKILYLSEGAIQIYIRKENLQEKAIRTNPRSLSPHILLLEISAQFLKIFEERMKPILADLGELKDYQYRAVKFEAGLHDLMTEGEGNSDILIYSKIYNNGIPMPNLCGMKIELDGKKWTGFIFNRSQLEQFLNICLNKQ
jgi:hypothetical protein